MANEYTPGACNIGPEEIRLRKLFGWIGVVVCTAVWAGFIFFDAPPVWRLMLFFPAVLAALGHLQAARRFCVAFGWRGQFNMGPNLGKTSVVDQADFRRQDRRLAARMLGLSFLAGILAAATAYCL